MDKVQVNVEHSRRVGLFCNNMRVPDFLEESFWHSVEFCHCEECSSRRLRSVPLVCWESALEERHLTTSIHLIRRVLSHFQIILRDGSKFTEIPTRRDCL